MSRLITLIVSITAYASVINAQKKPHILFFLIDDLGYTDISHNNAEYKTPHIDALYESGVELSNYYVHLVCTPTRSSVMTGKYSWKTGLQYIGTIPPATTEHLPYDTPTMAELMKSAGYATYGFGKWHLGYAAWNMTPIARGFDNYFGMFQGEQFYYNHTFQAPPPMDAALAGYDFWDNKQTYYDARGNYSNELYEKRIVSILNNYNSKTDKPLFMYIAFQTIHEPIEEPPKTYDTCSNVKPFMRQIYCNKILFMDESIGNIINTLKTNNLYDNTLIALSTDNGGMPYWLNENTPYPMALSYGCNHPLRAGKATLFEGGVKGVGILSGALVEKRGLSGTKNNMMTHCSDWLTTFYVGIAGQTLPANIDFDGEDIWSSLDNEANWNRTTLYVNIDIAGYHNQTNSTLPLFAIINNDTESNTVWKYIEGEQLYTNYYFCNQTSYGPSNLTKGEWLFNLSVDPLETTDLSEIYPEQIVKLKEMIQDKIDNGGYIDDQDGTVYPDGLPALHKGVWAPFLR